MSGLLSVLVPIAITSAILQSTTAPTDGYPAWTNTGTFAQGDYCYSPTTQHVYRSLIANNVGKDPTVAANRATSTDGTATVPWLDVGATNPYAMFDKKVSTQTTADTNLTVVLRPGVFTSLYLAGLDANAVSVMVKDAPGGNVVFSYSGTLEASAPADYYEYFYDPFAPLTDLQLSDIPQYGSAELTLTLAKPSGTVKCGALAVGDIKVLGYSLAEAEAEPNSYAYIDTDQWGNATIVDGAPYTNLTISAYTDTRDAGRLAQAIVTSLLGTPAFWSCTDTADGGGLRAYGLGSAKFSYTAQRCNISATVKGFI